METDTIAGLLESTRNFKSSTCNNCLKQAVIEEALSAPGRKKKAVKKRNQKGRWCPPMLPSLQRHFPVVSREQYCSLNFLLIETDTPPTTLTVIRYAIRNCL